jgi:hypothetical protein
VWLLIPLLLLVLLVAAIVSAGAALVFGAGALVFGILREWPWLLIVFGVWMLVRPGRGRHRRRWERPVAPAPAASRPSAAASPEARPHPSPLPEGEGMGVAPRRELPIDLRVKVEQIRHKADVLLGYAERFPPFSADLHIVRQTAADYLPRTVDAYLALPGLDDPVIPESGKTALQELREQLLLLDSKLDDIAQDLQRQDIDHLLANRRFLEDRFRPNAGAA